MDETITLVFLCYVFVLALVSQTLQSISFISFI